MPAGRSDAHGGAKRLAHHLALKGFQGNEIVDVAILFRAPWILSRLGCGGRDGYHVLEHCVARGQEELALIAGEWNLEVTDETVVAKTLPHGWQLGHTDLPTR
eukprot:1103100-Amphidinium_carterae.2